MDTKEPFYRKIEPLMMWWISTVPKWMQPKWFWKLYYWHIDKVGY